jgi:rifampicin phosphotransferase
LMRIAEQVDLKMPQLREWILATQADEVWWKLRASTHDLLVESADLQHQMKTLLGLLEEFLDRYGFRCVNELKLEENDLHDDPGFVVQAVLSYVKMKTYSISTFEDRERLIREQAEGRVRERISGLRAWVYFFILRQARKAVSNRENLRFARTKIFGVARHLFRGMGTALVKLGVLENSKDVFYLTVEELIAWVEGRSVLLNLRGLVQLRKEETEGFKRTPSPPERLMTVGSVGASCLYPQVLFDSDLLRGEGQASTDPNVLMGTPCSPGVIEGVVRVVHSIEDAKGMQGEILVTARTDPGWVPLFPSCSGLLVERGSLLSHSAVVARELGLPTIVGVSGGLMTKLKNNQRIRMDAAKGEIRILA